MHIKTLALELDKCQHAMTMTNIGLLCKYALKVVTYVTSMYAYRVFIKLEMVKWENGGPKK